MELLIFQLALMFLAYIQNPIFAEPELPTPLSLPKPGCRKSCGNIDIPYPFGIGPKCYHNKWFEITCNSTLAGARGSRIRQVPYLGAFKAIKMEVVDITLANQTITIKSTGFSRSVCRNSTPDVAFIGVDLSGTPYLFSRDDNVFTVKGCGTALLVSGGRGDDQPGGDVLAGCLSMCNPNFNTTYCYGINCCETLFPYNLHAYGVRSLMNCTHGFLRKIFFDVPDNWSPSMPVEVVFYWKWDRKWNARKADDQYCPLHIYDQLDLVNHTYASSDRCFCNQSHSEGNPYLPAGGCKVPQNCVACDDGYCVKLDDYTPFTCYSSNGSKHKPVALVLGLSIGAGVILLAAAALWLHKVIKKRKIRKRREKFFKRNGGLLLQQQMSSDNGVLEKTRLFSAKELEKATGQFNEDRVLGRGGQGTVYKGMLTDGRIVAVKKSKLVDERQLEQFINEVVILSQISHKNVVKLLGCCLETEVPMLVYEFVSNGTLSKYIQDENNEFPTSWNMRLRIAAEAAGALAYLHYSTSIPIYHRDIKSTNILLDEKLRAKVSDFGISRHVADDQTHMTTLVKGTFGYLDPEYFQSSQFTKKSDVYSFGVVLVELLTGRKPVFASETGGQTSLATFVLSLEEGSLLENVDERILDGPKEQVMAVAQLAKRCLNLNGKMRPTMKEVSIELEASHKYDTKMP